MKSLLPLRSGRNVASVFVLCFGLALFAASGAWAASGVVLAPPAAIQRPPSPSAAVADDMEGYSVAGSGRFIVIGRPGREVERDGAEINAAGQAVVWELDESYLVDDVVQKRFWVINAPDPRTAHFFGGAVAAGDRWIAVAQGVSRVGVPYSGSAGTRTNGVQLIEFPPDGGWLPGPVLPGPADATYRASGWGFGRSLSMHGNRLVVGSGAGAFVYEVDSLGVWTRTQILNPGSGGEWVGFGHTVAIHGDLIVVGAPNSPDADIQGLFRGQGGAIVYRRGVGGLYAPEMELRAAGGTTNDNFGGSLAIEIRDGVEWIAVGAPGKDARLGPGSLQPNAGSTHLFRRILPDGEWTFHQEITNSFGGLTQQARAGSSIALSNGRLAVGAISSGGSPSPSPGGEVTFFYHDAEQDSWVRAGDESGGGLYGRYGLGLHGFEHGFLVGVPGSSSDAGDWEWRPTDPYVAFINSGSGPFVGGTSAHDRRADVDPDGDGILNSDELFFGSDPLTANTNGVIAPLIDTVANQFKLQWQQASNTFGLTSKVAWSTNMTTWVTNDLQIVPLGTVTNSTAKRFEARLSSTGRTNVFFRLLVE